MQNKGKEKLEISQVNNLNERVYFPNWDNAPPLEKSIMTFLGTHLLSKGGITTLCAKSGIGKSSIMEAFISNHLNPNCDSLGVEINLTKDHNKILFIEDIGELIYSSDRMLHQLKRSGKLTTLSGLIIGGFTDVKDTERPFGKKVKAVIKDILQDYDYPVCFDFPVGHQKENYALKIGGDFQLKITNTKVQLSEF